MHEAEAIVEALGRVRNWAAREVQLMQRKEIDRDEYEAIRAEMIGIVEIIGSVTTIEGRHEDHGAVILIRQAGRFFVDADDASHIRAKGMPPRQALQSSLAAPVSACRDART